VSSGEDFLRGSLVQQRCGYGSRWLQNRPRPALRFRSLPLDGLLHFQPFFQMGLLPEDRPQHPGHLFVFLHCPGEKVGCAKIEAEACIACQCPSQGTKQDFVVIVQIFDHRQLARNSRTLLEAGASQELRHRAERVGAKRADAFPDPVNQLIELGVLVSE